MLILVRHNFFLIGCFLFASFPLILTTLNPYISGTKKDIDKRYTAFVSVSNAFSDETIKKLPKISFHMHFNNLQDTVVFRSITIFQPCSKHFIAESEPGYRCNV